VTLCKKLAVGILKDVHRGHGFLTQTLEGKYFARICYRFVVQRLTNRLIGRDVICECSTKRLNMICSRIHVILVDDDDGDDEVNDDTAAPADDEQ